VGDRLLRQPLGDVAVRLLAAARRETGRRAGAGRDDPALELDALAAALEDDPSDRTALAAAETARRREDLVEADPPSGARALRERRAAEAHRAAGELILAGELVPDGPGRVRLPGFGGSTWRSIALLRGGVSGPARLLAEAVAAEPGADLGDAAPEFLRGLRLDRRLVDAARRIHVLEALRQDARDALLSAEAALAAALEAGHEDSARLLRDDCATLDARITEIDAAIGLAWEDGMRQAGAAPP
jgi:hypothetical protein